MKDRMLAALQEVVNNYDEANQEKYDELCWSRFNGVDPLRKLIVELEALENLTVEKFLSKLTTHLMIELDKRKQQENQ